MILWIAFLADFIFPSISDTTNNFNFTGFFISTISILAGLNILLARNKLFWLTVSLGLFVITVRILNTDFVPHWLEIVKDIILLNYYIIIIYEIFKELLDFSKVDLNTIGAVLTGFFVIGIMSGVVFALIEGISPNSFTGIKNGENPLSELVYFSFITLITIGYGDITPITQLAQRVTVLLGLIGNFYSTIVIGIIISKFLNSKNN